jgi:hypothetical protein
MKDRENCRCETNIDIQHRTSKPYSVAGFLVKFPMGEEYKIEIKGAEDREDKVDGEALGEGKYINGSCNYSDGRKGVDICISDIRVIEVEKE